VQDVPEPLRTQLIETTTSPNSGTIVIADRAGKEQLTQVMARRESGREEIAQPAIVPAEAAPAHTIRVPWLAWGGFVLVLLVAAVIYALFQSR
jgi:hypothetical protein